MIYVQSRGNRDGRPLYSYRQLEDMGYAGCIDAILAVGVQFHFMRKALAEITTASSAKPWRSCIGRKGQRGAKQRSTARRDIQMMVA